jgi:phosphoenolpyruvate carboxylase
MFQQHRLFRLIIDEVDKILPLVDLKVARSYAELVEDAGVRERIFGMIEEEYRLTRQMILRLTGEPEPAVRFRKYSRRLGRRLSILHQVSMEQVKLVRRFRARRKDDPHRLDDLIPLLLSINCVSTGLGWTG